MVGVDKQVAASLAVDKLNQWMALMTPADSTPCTLLPRLVLGEIMWGVLDAAPIGAGLAVKGPESFLRPLGRKARADGSFGQLPL